MNSSEITADQLQADHRQERTSPLRQLLFDAAQTFRVLYAPRRVLSLVVARGIWAVPVLALCVGAIVFGGADIIAALRAASAHGEQLANPEMQKLRLVRAGLVFGIIVLVFPLVLAVRAALAALLIRTVGSTFGRVPTYRQVLTISTFALCPMLVQFTLSFVGAHGHLFSTARWSSLRVLPSLSTRVGLDAVPQLLGYHLSSGIASALNLINPFEFWKYAIIFIGMRVFTELRPVALAASVVTPLVVDALLVYSLFWAAS